jgi:mono/diheme cytochrome c family protein
MSAPSVGIGFELPHQIAHVARGETRASRSVPRSVEPVAGEAGIGGTSIAAAQSDQLAGFDETIGRGAIHAGASANKACRGRDGGAKSPSFGPQHREWGTGGQGRRFRTLTSSRPKGGDLPRGHAIFPLLLLIGACKPPPENRQHMPTADPDRGRQAILSAGCGACHSIPGIRWPRGKSASALEGMAQRALIAGRVPNEPELLAAFVRDAPSLVPETTMPAMPVSEQQSRDIAAYLYEVSS